MTKAGEAWEALFIKFSIPERVANYGYYDISSDEFKSLHFEPRLLTKVDHSHQLPPVMKQNGLSILSLTNSTWRIGPFEVFEKLPNWTAPDDNVTHKALPSWLQSLTKDGITGEGALVNAADASGILNDFCGEDLLATITGKGRSSTFDFVVDNRSSGTTSISVKSAQIEIDAGFEGPNSLFLFEAKKHLSIDFNIRQLFYPFRTWDGRVAKKVRPIFITLANDVFDLTEFAFPDPRNMSSIELVSTRRFMLSVDLVFEREIVEIAKRVSAEGTRVIERHVPFPQADDFERVIDITEFVASEARSIEDISANYEFHPRQADYYFSAARYLGLGEIVRGSDGVKYRQVTKLGEEIIGLPYAAKRKAIAKLVLEIPAVREIYMLKVQHGVLADIAEAERIVFEHSRHDGISGSTIHRRAQTVLSWVRWLLSLDTSKRA
jgi:hypothetical protein